MTAPEHKHVFVSYSHAERDRAYVDVLTRHLGHAGVTTWYDDAIDAGQEGERVVADKIDTCAAFIVVMTPAAGASSWVAREIARAEKAGRHIFPLLLAGDVFFRLGTLHYDDVRGEIMPSDSCVQRLRDLVAAPTVAWGGVWAMQTPDAGLTSRPELIEPLVTRLTSAIGETVGVSTAMHGAGGFGKTTLARQVCADARVRARFRDGVWVTIGEETVGAALAERVNDVSYQLSGARPVLSDPDQAGLWLGALLDKRASVLLVVDDVWRPEQLRPFLHGGLASCSRLVTTRRPSTLPAGVRRSSIEVDQLTDTQARSLLTAGLTDVNSTSLTKLVKLTGRWPLLVQLAHRYLARNTRSMSTTAAVTRLVNRLSDGGPAILNLRDETSRERAVSASIAASMDLLTEAEQRRFVELGIFAEDIDIPRQALTLLWGITGDLDPADVDQLCDLLGDLSLVADQTDEYLRLHDVIRAYLRHRGRRDLGATNSALIAAARCLLPDHPADTAAQDSWWRLPDEQDYLWRNLVQHLSDAGAGDDLVQLVTDLRWIEAKLRRYGPNAVDVDMAQASHPVADALRHALRRNAHLFDVIEPSQALVDTLVSRLQDTPELATLLDAYTARMSATPRLVPHWPIPDQPHPALQQVLTGHRHTVVGCAMPPDGNWLATISHDHTARIWDARTGVLRQTLTGHTDEVFSCAAAPDGAWLATTSRDRTVRIWDVSTGALRHTMTGHSSPVTSCAAAPDGQWLATTSHDSTTRIWDTREGTLQTILVGHTGWVTACVIVADGSWIVTTSADRTARIWNTSTGKISMVLSGHTGGVLACAIGADGSWLATTSADGTARIWDVLTGALRHTLLGHTGPVTSCAAVGDWLATTSMDGTARLWDVRSGSPTHLLPHAGAVVSCTTAAAGSWLVTTSHDRTARIWDIETGTLLANLAGHTDQVVACVVAPDGGRLATTSRDRTIRIWDTTTTRPDDSSASHSDDVLAFTFALSGAWGASVSVDGSARIWDADASGSSAALIGHSDAVLAATCSPDSAWLVTGGRDGTARIWNADPPYAGRHVLTGHTAEVVACAVAPDGTWLATASRDGTARIWDAGAGLVRSVLDKHTDELLGCAVAPDGTWLATIGRDDTARIWDVSSGRLRFTLNHTNEVLSCAIAPDGSWLLTTSNDRASQLWDPATGLLRHALAGHTAPVTCCAAGPDGSWAATGGKDHMVRIWDTQTGELRHHLSGHTAAVTSCAAAPSGGWLASTGADSTVRIWDVKTGAAVTAVKFAEQANTVTWHPTAAVLTVAGRGGVYAFTMVA